MFDWRNFIFFLQFSTLYNDFSVFLLNQLFAFRFKSTLSEQIVEAATLRPHYLLFIKTLDASPP